MENFPKNLAELKRFLKGNVGKIRLTLVQFNQNGNPSTQHKFLNIPRRLTSASTTYFGLTATNMESYCEYPKAKDLILDQKNRNFSVLFDDNCKLTYHIEEN